MHCHRVGGLGTSRTTCCSSLRRPARLQPTTFAGLPADASRKTKTAGAPPGATPQAKVLTVVTVDSTGVLSKQKISISGQSSLDRVLSTRRSLGLIALNDPDTQPVAVSSLEEVQYDREYRFAGDTATYNILRAGDENWGLSGNNGGHGGVASTLSEQEALAARLARMYPQATSRPDLCSVTPSPEQPHHDAPLAAQRYEVALELTLGGPDSAAGRSSGANGSGAHHGAGSNGSNGATSSGEAVPAPAAAALNGKASKAPRSKRVLILGSYVAWLEGKRIDEAQKRIAALRRRATLPEEWPAYAKYSGYDIIALVLLAHKVAEGEEDLVECLSSHHGVRVLLTEGELDMMPSNYPLNITA